MCLGQGVCGGEQTGARDGGMCRDRGLFKEVTAADEALQAQRTG